MEVVSGSPKLVPEIANIDEPMEAADNEEVVKDSELEEASDEDIGWAVGVSASSALNLYSSLKMFSCFQERTYNLDGFFGENNALPEIEDKGTFFASLNFYYLYILFLELSLDELESYGKERDRHDQYGYFLPIQKKSDVFKDPKFVLINDFLNREFDDETLVILIYSFCILYYSLFSEYTDIIKAIPPQYVEHYGSIDSWFPYLLTIF